MVAALVACCDGTGKESSDEQGYFLLPEVYSTRLASATGVLLFEALATPRNAVIMEVCNLLNGVLSSMLAEKSIRSCCRK